MFVSVQVITIQSEAFEELMRKNHPPMYFDKAESLKPVYNNKELCLLLKVSTRTLQNWRDKGYIGFSQISGTIIYSSDDIITFLKNHHNPPFKSKDKTF